jgi:hypothetical protein
MAPALLFSANRAPPHGGPSHPHSILANGDGKKGGDPLRRRIAELEAQIEKRDQVIGEFTIANRILKKLSGQSL